MNDLAKSVRGVMVVFLFFFVGLITYIAYFQVFRSPVIAANSGNGRLLVKRNEVLRGTIYDRDGKALTKSTKIDEFSQKREYLMGDLYAHALGYENERYGLTGLEESFDDELTKTNNSLTSVKQFIKSLKPSNLIGHSDEEKIGNGVVTTLDPKLQKVAYDALGDQKGSVVAINPKTGEVLAMVSKPTYDPNDLEQVINDAASGVDKDSKLLNRAIDGVYPPGSVFKTVTLSAALENDPSVATRTFHDKGYIGFDDGTRLYNFMQQANGDIDLKTGYKVSSNVVFGTLAMELGNAKLKEEAERFGFNSVINGVGFTATKSQFPTLDASAKGDIAQSGIGQGSVSSTPMQMACVAAAVANDGVLMQPRLVNKVLDKNGATIKQIQNKVLKDNVVPKDVDETVKSYMQNLVAKNLYRWPDFEGTGAGGKTGTADYMENGELGIPHAWFISIAPVKDPKIAVAVIVEKGESGAHISADIAAKVVKEAVGTDNGN